MRGEAGTLLPGQTEKLVPGLAFGNHKPSIIVIGPDKCNGSLPYIHVVDQFTGQIVTRFLAYELQLLGRRTSGDRRPQRRRDSGNHHSAWQKPLAAGQGV